MFELSVQAVNPAVTIPYWDYTIDAANAPYIFTSFPFRSKTFGIITQPADNTYLHDKAAHVQ